MSECQFPAPKKICRGSHFKLEHISILPHGIFQPALPLASSASLCLSDKIPFTPSSFIKSSLPGLSPSSSKKLSCARCSGLVGTPTWHHSFCSQPFSNSSSASPLLQLRSRGLEGRLCSTSPFVPHPHPSPWSESLRLLLLPKRHSFDNVLKKLHPHSVYSEFPSLTTPHLRY